MKRKYSKIITVSAFALIICGGLLTIKTVENPVIKEENNKESKNEGDEISGYLKMMRERYADPITHEYNIDAIAASRNSLAQYYSSAKPSRAFPKLEWTERGPNDVGGRTRCLLVDKTNPSKILAATAGGGLFSSTNAGETWTKNPLLDSFPSIQGSSIAQSINGDIYFATGEGYTNNNPSLVIEGGSSFPGDGIFKSTDGGVTFKQLQSTRPATNSASGWAYISRVVCSPSNNDILYAGTSNGLKKSINGGTTWTNAANGTLASATITDLKITPTGAMLVGTTAGVFTSPDGITFTSRWATGGLPGKSIQRAEIAYAPSNPNHLYLITINTTNPGGGLLGVFQSLDFGTTWTTMINGGGTFEPFGTNPPNSIYQGFWGVSMAVNPTNENEFYIGGMQNLYRYNPTTLFKPVAFWQGNVALGQEIHSDIHYLTFANNDPNKFYACTDGGVYRSDNAADVTPKFGEKNDGLNALQGLCFDVSSEDKVICGAQDNGTNIIGLEANSKLTSRRVYGGDGGNCAFSDIFPDVVFGSVSNESDMARSTSSYPEYASFHNTDGSGKSIYDRNIDGGWTVDQYGNLPKQDGRPDDQTNADAIWSMPMYHIEKAVKTGPSHDSIELMVIGTYNDIWFTQKSADVLQQQPSWFKVYSAAGSRFTAINVSKDGSTIYGATSSPSINGGPRTGRIIRIKGLHLLDSNYQYKNSANGNWNQPTIVAEDLGVQFNNEISSITTSLDANGEDMIVTTSNYGIYTNYVNKISNCKTGIVPLTAVDISNNLPVMPVNDAAFIPPVTALTSTGANMIILGTMSGLWGSKNGGTTWEELNIMSGTDATLYHPRVPVVKVLVRNLTGYTGPVINTCTHGRGMFTSYSLATKWPTEIKDVVKQNLLSIYPNPVVNNAIVELTATKANQATVQIINMSGSLVNQFTYQIQNGTNKIPVDMSILPKGGYIVSVITNGTRYTNTLIKE